MATTRPDPDPAPEASRRAVDGSPPRAPRWVKVLAGIALLLVLVVVIALVAGGSGGHGPARHSGEDAAPAGRTAPGGAAAGHRRSPAGARHADR